MPCTKMVGCSRKWQSYDATYVFPNTRSPRSHLDRDPCFASNFSERCASLLGSSTNQLDASLHRQTAKATRTKPIPGPSLRYVSCGGTIRRPGRMGSTTWPNTHGYCRPNESTPRKSPYTLIWGYTPPTAQRHTQHRKETHHRPVSTP